MGFAAVNLGIQTVSVRLGGGKDANWMAQPPGSYLDDPSLRLYADASSPMTASPEPPRWRIVWAWVVEGELAPVLLALILLAVPTAYTLYSPEFLVSVTGAKPLPVRIVVGAVWFVAAIVGVIRQRSVDRSNAALLRGRIGERDEVTAIAVNDVLGALLRPGTLGTPPEFDWMVFAFDRVRSELQPIFPAPADEDLPLFTFRPGAGATGRAYEQGGIVVVLGDAVSNADYGLSPAQQQRFAHYRSVVAAQMSWKGRPIGALTAISETENTFFSSASGQATVLRLAQSVAAVLASMLGMGDPAGSIGA